MLKIYLDSCPEKLFDITKVFNHIFDVIGCKVQYTKYPNEANVIYSSNYELKKDDILFFYFDKKIWGKDLESIHLERLSYISEDCIYKCFYLLNRLWEKNASKDSVGVVKIYGNSSLFFLKKAFIGDLIRLIRKDILEKINLELVPLWPNGAKFCLVLSHDVDLPFKNLQISYLKDEFFWKYKNNQSKLSLLKTTFKIFNSFLSQNLPNENFGFDFWYDLESRLNGNSAFYVSVVNSYQSYAHRLDVPYNFSDIRIKKELCDLIQKGWEIGLHASINSCNDINRIAQEKEKLESILDGYKVKGIRHHYWRLGSDIAQTHKNQFQSGFEYDSSLGLNDQIGFRSGTVWPYEILSDQNLDNSSYFQIPPTLMDGNIFYYKDKYLNYYQQLKSHFEYVEDLNGCVVLDWHLEQSNFKRLNGAGILLKNFLLQEVIFKEVFIASPINLINWWKERRSLIENLK